MAIHISVIFKSGRFRLCSFPLCFWKRIFNILEEALQTKQTEDAFVHPIILITNSEIETLGNRTYQRNY